MVGSTCAPHNDDRVVYVMGLCNNVMERLQVISQCQRTAMLT